MCTKGLLCSGNCRKPFCVEHDGRRKIHSLDYSGKVCSECAVKVNKCRKILMWLMCLTVFLMVGTIVSALPYFF